MPFDATNFVDVVSAPIVETEAQKLVRRARSYVDTPAKWAQGADVFAEGRACIGLACNNVRVRSEDTAYSLLAKAIGVPTEGVPRWNDAPERTHAEVMAAFDRAYELAASPTPSP